MSALEKLQKIEDDVDEIKKTLLVIDRSLKQLINQRLQISATPSGAAVPEDDDLFKFSGSSGPVHRPKTIKVFGYIQRTGGIPIPDVMVTVWNDKDEEVLKRITSANGYWECRLPTGKYAIEWSGDNVRPINKVIMVDNSVEQMEVV